MNKTPNTNQNDSSELGYNVKFWSGIVVGYEYQQDQLSNGNGWRYKVRIFGDNSDVDQVDDKDLSYADVLLSTDAGSGAAYKLRSARISQGDTVYGIKGPNLPPMIIGVEPRKRSTILYTEGKFKTLSGFYGSLTKNNILSGEFNEQLGPATPGGKPYTKTKSEREPAADKLNEIGIDPNEEGVVEDVTDQIATKEPDVTEPWTGGSITKEKIFDIQEQVKNGKEDPKVLRDAAKQGEEQGILEKETTKKLVADAEILIANNTSKTYTVAGVEYSIDTGLPVEIYVDAAGNEYTSEDLEKLNTPSEEIDGPRGTFDENMNYIPPGFEDAITIDEYLNQS